MQGDAPLSPNDAPEPIAAAPSDPPGEASEGPSEDDAAAETLSSASGAKKRRRRATKRQQAFVPGSMPGTLVASPDATQSRLTITAYGPLGVETPESCDLDRFKELASRHAVIWINVDGLADVALIETIGEIFGLDRLSLEDVVNAERQRPKLEVHDRYEFVVLRKAAFEADVFQSEGVALFFGPGWIVTFHESPSHYLEPIRERLVKNRGKLRKTGSDYLAYCVIDCVIDHYFPALAYAAAKVGDLDEEIFLGASEQFPNEVRHLRGELVRFLRLVMPVRDVLNKMISDPGSRMAPGTKPYLKDCLDHALQVIDQIGTLRHASSDLMNHYHLSMTHRMNETMKVLTMIATIFIPLTFITSVYGMNFDTGAGAWSMPELHWRYGYPTVLLIMLALAVGMLLYFQRKGWIGTPRRKRTEREG
jgi:magnesium transporter